MQGCVATRYQPGTCYKQDKSLYFQHKGICIMPVNHDLKQFYSLYSQSMIWLEISYQDLETHSFKLLSSSVDLGT